MTAKRPAWGITWEKAAAVIQARAAGVFGEAVDADQLPAMNAWLAEVNFPYAKEMIFVLIPSGGLVPPRVCLMKKGADYGDQG